MIKNSNKFYSATNNTEKKYRQVHIVNINNFIGIIIFRLDLI